MNYRDPTHLRDHMRSILNFYHPACIDYDAGGYFNQFLDDGTIYEQTVRHLVSTCRFVYNYAIGWQTFGENEYRAAAAHGLDFIQNAHRQPDGGFAWVLQKTELGKNEVADGTRHAYGHAFVLLAAAASAKCDLAGATDLVAETYDLLESHFWEPQAQLYVDEIAANDWNAISPYRGQNANMHLCEAMLCAFEATGEARYLDRAHTLATRICVDLTASSDGQIWEHYHTDWTHDWDYNKDDPQHLFKPYGYVSGHFVEWTKLLLILEKYKPEAWMLPTAKHLFDIAMQKCWDHDDGRGGMHYTFAPDGRILDTDRYFWVIAEAFAAAALLAIRTDDQSYWTWYDKAWDYADQHFIDHKYGGWYRVLDAQHQKYSNEKSPAAKTDYHPLAACFETLAALGAV